MGWMWRRLATRWIGVWPRLPQAVFAVRGWSWASMAPLCRHGLRTRGDAAPGQPATGRDGHAGTTHGAKPKLICHVRLKRSGAWWYEDSSNPMLALRCAKSNGTFEQVFTREQRQKADA
jgi:hypothetical protein